MRNTARTIIEGQDATIIAAKCGITGQWNANIVIGGNIVGQTRYGATSENNAIVAAGQEAIATMLPDREHNPTTWCPECEESHQATNPQDGISQCPHCGTECVVGELTATREGDDGQQETIGTFHTMAAARQAINDLLATEWGDATIVLEDKPQEGGFWVDSADDKWTIQQ